MLARIVLVTACTAILSGCWNGQNSHINLGNVSIGQQLIDLQKALELGAVTQPEYETTKETLLSLNTVCESVDEED